MIAQTLPTCSTCPYFDNYHEFNGHGWCKAFDQPARTHHVTTNDCHQQIEAIEPNVTVTADINVEPSEIVVEPVIVTTPEMVLYAHPDPTITVVHSRSGKRYEVKCWTTDFYSCTCPHHAWRKVECKHINEVKKNPTLLPEPYTLLRSGDRCDVKVGHTYVATLARNFTGGWYQTTGVSLRTTETPDELAAIAYASWFRSQRLRHEQAETVLNHYAG